MPQPPRVPSSLRRQVFRVRDAVAAGLVTREQLRGPAWQRLARGVYADAVLPLDHGLKALATALAIPPGAALTGISAAWLWGAHLASSTDPVDVLCPPGRRQSKTPNLRVRTSPLPDTDRDTLSGIPLTSPLRTAWELALRLDPIDAVVYCDALARLDRLSEQGLREYLAARTGQHGCRAAQRVFPLVDHRAESPQESRLRVHLTLGGLPPPMPQYEVRLRGRCVARVDLAWPKARLAVEYDGAWHAATTQLINDRRRLNRLQAAGWYVHYVTAADMTDLGRLVAVVRSILAHRHP